MVKRSRRILVTLVATALVAALLPAAALAAGQRISGTVTDTAGTPLAGILVSAFTISAPVAGNITFTGSDGSYAVGGLAAGSYRVQFADPTGAHPAVYYTSTGFTFDSAGASPVVIGSADVGGINVKLPGPPVAAGRRISGTVTDTAGNPLAGILVSAVTISAPIAGDITFTASDGSYAVGGLPAGSYRVQFADPTGAHPAVFYTSTGFTFDAAAATPVVIGSADVSGINVKLPGPGVGPVTPTKLSTPIKASIRAGVSQAGTFVSGRTLVVRRGQYVTARFYLGQAFAGKLIQVLYSTRDATGQWKAYRVLTNRRVQANGYAYYSAPIRGWRAFRAKYAGDATHKVGLSSRVVAFGR